MKTTTVNRKRNQNRDFRTHIDRSLLPKTTKNKEKANKKKYSKYLNCNNIEERRLSRGNKLYVKRILKQNKEYREMQVSLNL